MNRTGTLSGAPKRVSRIARTDLRNRKRSIEGSNQIIALVISGLFGVLFGFIGIIGLFIAGRAVGDTAVLGPARGVGAGVFGIMAVMATIRVAQGLGLPSEADGLLTTVTHREAVAGYLLAEIAVLLGIPTPFVLIGALAFGIGAGSAVSVVLVAVAALSLGVLGVLCGIGIGTGVRVLVARSPVLARFRGAIGVVLTVAYFWVLFAGSTESVFEPIFAVVRASPVGWYGDLALLAVQEVDLHQVAGAIGVTLVGIPGVGGLCGLLAGQLWYRRAVAPTVASGSSEMGSVPIAGNALPLPTRHVIHKTWLRARRAPLRLLYAGYPLFLLVPALADIAQLRVPASLPGMIAFYGAWATGATFTLNPIGDEEAVLPITLTTPIRGRSFIGALCLAGLLIGLPVTVLAAVLTGVIASPALSSGEFLGVGIVAIVLPVTATTIAVGAGTAFPRLESAPITRSREAVVPSAFAFALFSLVFGFISLPALSVLTPATRHVLGFTSELAVLAGGIGLTVVLGAVAGVVSVSRATAAFENYYYE
ncbi:hypothetical protein [Halocatena pleomorpha]|uniref:ABC-2 type transport system permease protein n=1 Tax=Halocatena pleomorpha TaxID=1785090 RepID=A0A3P3RC08_9EURY|nr:hypothetical protein [Halocatena pleomorpha]RRJ31012.1 hypothetical protein EIK79_08350 [Halocatena pleomorpha]